MCRQVIVEFACGHIWAPAEGRWVCKNANKIGHVIDGDNWGQVGCVCRTCHERAEHDWQRRIHEQRETLALVTRTGLYEAASPLPEGTALPEARKIEEEERIQDGMALMETARRTAADKNEDELLSVEAQVNFFCATVHGCEDGWLGSS